MYHKFPTPQAPILGIYEMACPIDVWDISSMGTKTDKKKLAERRALAIARHLAALRPADLTERQWCIAAGVSSSFFSNLRGTPDKPPSEPTIGNLRSILDVVGITLPEFFADEARGRLVSMPNGQALEQALRDALPGLPKDQDRQLQYLYATVADVLELPSGTPAIAANEQDHPDPPAPAKSAHARRSTK
jgi:hypothetical protein